LTFEQEGFTPVDQQLSGFLIMPRLHQIVLRGNMDVSHPALKRRFVVNRDATAQSET